MADKFDFDDNDIKLEDELGNFDIDMDDPFATPPPPANKREAIARSLKNAAKGFASSITSDPIESAGTMLDSAIPDSLSKEKKVFKEVTSGVKEEFTKAGRELRGKTRTTVRAIERFLPKESKLQKVASTLASRLEEPTYKSTSPSRDELLNNEVNDYLETALGDKTNRDVQEQLLRDQVEANRYKSAIELANIQVSNLDNIRKFNVEVQSKYFRESLKLQYSSLFIQKELLSVSTVAFDTFKLQLESIVNNTALPDFIKLKKMEAVKGIVSSKVIGSATDKLYKDSSTVDTVRKNISRKITDAKSKVLENMGMVSDAAEMSADQKEMLKSMEEMGISKEELAGGALGGTFLSKLGKAIGSKVDSNKVGKVAISQAKKLASDPSKFFSTKALKTAGSVGLVGQGLHKLYGFLGDITRKEEGYNIASIDRDDINKVATFDNKVYRSVTNVIPDLLSKIYSEVKWHRTKEDPDTNEITYDFKTDEFLTKKQITSKFKKELARQIEVDTEYPVDKVLSVLSEQGGLSITKNNHANLRKSVLKYIMDGKNTSPSSLLEEGFQDYFDKDNKDRVARAINKILEKSVDDPYIFDKIQDGLDDTRSSIPGINEKIKEIRDMGRSDLLEKMGLIKRDESNRVSLDVDRYKQMATDTYSKSKLRSSFVQYDETDNVNRAEEDSIPNDKIKPNIFNKISKFAVKPNIMSTTDIPTVTEELSTDTKEPKPIIKQIVEKTTKNELVLETIKQVQSMDKSVRIANKDKIMEIMKNVYSGNVKRTQDMITTLISAGKEKIPTDTASIKDKVGNILDKGKDIKEKSLSIKDKLVGIKDKIKSGEYKDKWKSFTKKTRAIDRNIFNATVGKIIPKLKVKSPEEKEEARRKKSEDKKIKAAERAAIFDKDKSGRRDGDWRDRLEALNKKKETTSTKPSSAAETKTDSGSGFGLMSIFGLVGGLGTVLKSILSGVLGMGKMLGSVAKGVLTIIPGALRTVGGLLLKPLTIIPNLLGNVLGFIHKLPGVLKMLINPMGIARAAGGGIAKAGRVAASLGGAGLKGALKFGLKAGARLIPGVGAAMLAWDAVNIGKRMLVDGESFGDAFKGQVFGMERTPEEIAADPTKKEQREAEVAAHKEQALKAGDEERERLENRRASGIVENKSTVTQDYDPFKEEAEKNRKITQPATQNELRDIDPRDTSTSTSTINKGIMPTVDPIAQQQLTIGTTQLKSVETSNNLLSTINSTLGSSNNIQLQSRDILSRIEANQIKLIDKLDKYITNLSKNTNANTPIDINATSITNRSALPKPAVDLSRR